MTSKRTVTLLYSLHSWCGIVTSVWLFVVCVSGALLVFKDDIDLWANPSLRDLPRATVVAGPDAVLGSLQAKYPEARLEFMAPPRSSFPVWTIYTRDGENLRTKYTARADTGEVAGPVDSELGQFIRNIHVFVMFGPRWPVGFLGVVALFSLASGFVIHRKVLRELFTLRWGRSPRVVSADVHRAAGVWGLGFHAVISFTGAWLGLAPVFERAHDYLLEPAPSASASPATTGPATTAPATTAPATTAPATTVAMTTAVAGDPPSARVAEGGAAVTEDRASLASIESRSIDAVLERARREQAGFDVQAIVFSRLGQPDARVRLSGSIEGSALTGVSSTYSLRTGALIERTDPREQGGLRYIEAYMEPLHFGDFGGVVLRWGYLLLGLVSAGLTVTGTLVWLERRKLERRALLRASGSAPTDAGTVFERGMIGLHCGAVASLAMMAALSLWCGRGLELLPLNDGGGPLLWLGLWGVMSAAIARPHLPRDAWRAGLIACGATLASAALTGVLQRSPVWASVGASAIALGAGCVALSLAVGSGDEPSRRTRGSAVASSGPPAPGVREPLERVARATPWLVWAATIGLSFAWAWRGEGAAVQGPGHAGMLLSIFLLLPGLMVRSWFRRAAAAAWLLSALGFAALGLRSEHTALGLLAAPMAAVAVVIALRREPGRAASERARELDEARA